MLPLLYLHGLSSGDFVSALEQFLGSTAGLSAATVSRLTQHWQADHAAFGERDLSGSDYVYVWADGIHLRIRLREAKSCVLVLMDASADATKELIAMSDGYRESADSWADLLRDCARRGALPSLRSATAHSASGRPWPRCSPKSASRCWVHKIASVANALPKSAQPGAKKALQEMYNAEDRDHAQRAWPHSPRPTVSPLRARPPRRTLRELRSLNDRN